MEGADGAQLGTGLATVNNLEAHQSNRSTLAR
jgi:hypothetical protein